MRKFIILFVLSLSVTYAQQGWREGVRDSILIAKGKIYDSTYTRIDSVISVIPQLSIPQTIGGWYKQDIEPQLTKPFTDEQMYRGFGSMDNDEDILNYYSVTKVGGRISASPLGYTIISLYRNGYNTGASVTLTNTDVTYTNFAYNIINVAPKDKLTLKAKFVSTLTEDPIDVKGYIELTSNVNQSLTFDYAVGSYTFTATAVTDGTVKLVDNDDNTDSGISPSLAGLSVGDTVWAIATPSSGFRFWCWTGAPMDDNDNIENDTAYYVITGDIDIRARFQTATPTSIVAVIIDSDTTHATAVKTSFVTGYSGTFTDSVHIKYYTSPASNLENAYKFCDSVGAHILIWSSMLANLAYETAQTYYPIQSFYPSGANTRTNVLPYINSADDLPAVIFTGAGTDNGTNEDTCETGYPIEFWSDEFITVGSNQSSYSNGYIAGYFWSKLKGRRTADTTGGINGYDYYGVRYASRMNWDGNWTAWSKGNGYGSISGDKWNSFNGSLYLSNTLQYYPTFFRDNDPYLKR